MPCSRAGIVMKNFSLIPSNPISLMYAQKREVTLKRWNRVRGITLGNKLNQSMLTKMTAMMMKWREVMEKRSTELKGAE